MPSAFGGKVEGKPMSNNSGGTPKTVIPFAPKLDTRSDELDRASHAILEVLHQAVATTEAKYQQAVEKTHQLSAQLRSVEGRVKDLEAQVLHHEARADRAEDWLYQISVDIEQKFFNDAPAPALGK
jgi:septal ring factor EnvC (AmiA/AmiB activator)